MSPATRIFLVIRTFLTMLRFRASPRMTVGQISDIDIVEKCRRLGRTRELQWSENTPRTGEPECRATWAC
jgi:hypothetical protein